MKRWMWVCLLLLGATSVAIVPGYDKTADEGKPLLIYSGRPTWRAGAVGATGAAGAAGATGATGAVGATGANGTVGATGARGATGVTGAVGATGATAATGPKGATGATGANGLNGLNGAAAPSGMLLGDPSNYAAGPSNDQSGATILTAYFALASTGATNGSFKIPAGDPVGTFRVVMNSSSNTLTLYPAVGETIINVGTGISLTTSVGWIFLKKSSTNWGRANISN